MKIVCYIEVQQRKRNFHWYKCIYLPEVQWMLVSEKYCYTTAINNWIR